MPLTPIQTEDRSHLLAKLAAGEYRLERLDRCLCDSADSVSIADHDRFGIPVGVVLCQACGLARTTPRLATANLASFYQTDYHGLHLSVRRPDPDQILFRRRPEAAIHPFLADLLPPGPLSVADVGAGTGRDLRAFAEAVGGPIHVVGCDFSEAFAAAGRAAGTDIRHGGPETLIEFAPYDAVILSHVVEHFPNPTTDLAAIRSLGHDGTLFYVEVPGLLSIDRKPEYAYRLDRYLTLAHTFHFTLDTLAATMKRAGFRLVRGDEEVRAAFIPAPVTSPPNDSEMATRILTSLRRLDSWPMRLRRVKPALRQRLVVAARAILPVSWIKALRHRSR
ncbi:MAG: class I SAM-dependent methyltransferase [Chloroflexota bacterium]